MAQSKHNILNIARPRAVALDQCFSTMQLPPAPQCRPRVQRDTALAVSSLTMSHIKTTALKPFGLQIDDLRLDDGHDGDTIEQLRDLWAEHGLLLFRDQQLDEAALVQFSRQFGTLEIHVRKEYLSPSHPEILIISNIRERDRRIGILGEHEVGWHHDQIYQREPALGSLLYAIELPPRGGDTSFANLAMAYEALPATMRERIAPLRAVQSYAFFNGTWSEPTNEEQTRQTPDVTHPLVRTHPRTRRRAIYADPGMTPVIEGLATDESRALLDELFAWCTQERFIYHHQWRLGDALMWDNASTMHRRGEFDERYRRLMHRTTILPPPDQAVPF